MHCHRTVIGLTDSVIGLCSARPARNPEESCTVIALSSSVIDFEEFRRILLIFLLIFPQCWPDRPNTRRSHALSSHCHSKSSNKPEESCTVIALSSDWHILVMDLSWTFMDLCADRAILFLYFSWNIPLPSESCHWQWHALSSHCHRHEIAMS